MSPKLLRHISRAQELVDGDGPGEREEFSITIYDSSDNLMNLAMDSIAVICAGEPKGGSFQSCRDGRSEGIARSPEGGSLKRSVKSAQLPGSIGDQEG